MVLKVCAEAAVAKRPNRIMMAIALADELQGATPAWQNDDGTDLLGEGEQRTGIGTPEQWRASTTVQHRSALRWIAHLQAERASMRGKIVSPNADEVSIREV